MDEFGRWWSRSEVYPGRWFLFDTPDGVVWWDEPGLGWSSAEPESQSTAASVRISAFPARAVHTWKFGVLFPSGFVSGSHTSCVWVLPVEYRKLNSPAILSLFAQCLARQWTHVLHQCKTLPDENYIFSTLTWT